ncbi:MAG: phosphoribosylaminoimidazolesuccinocarboxamide synthase [Gammaproteobacteria bacterium]|nr:phosphoribosylaminoimidazolesuccinocarboxamide synthase [Gammaproteobacteria bacterium]
MVDAVFESRLESLPLLARGKVRDIYAIDETRLLIVASDRLSAFDVVLPDPIPGKGRILTAISNHWFGLTRHIVPNHLLDESPEAYVTDPAERRQIEGRAVVVRRLKPLPVEAVVRGYLIGSGWQEYQRSGTVCGIALPAGLELAARLPETIFTPATKAQRGDHDENITFKRMTELVGHDIAQAVRSKSIEIYEFAAGVAATRGLIIADTKFEFAWDERDGLILIDEVLTPDSSRFWPAASYRPGSSPESFDKQFVRDYLETLAWDKRAPGPRLPEQIIAATAGKYQQGLALITGAASG